MDCEALKEFPSCVAIKFIMFLENPEMLCELTGLPGSMIVNLTSKEDRSVKTDTEEKLDRITDALLHRPLLFRCVLKHEVSTKKENYTLVETWNAHYAVLINPLHPAIQEFLHPLLTEASNHVNAGEKFSLKIKFGKFVKDWFLRNVDDGRECSNQETTLSGATQNPML